jgi:uncharacterized protein (DUF983 family)
MRGLTDIPFVAGLACRCPRCGKGRLFQGFIDVAPACDRCGLSYSFAEPSDGAAVLVMFIAGILVLGFALWLDMTYGPPFWVELLVDFPVAIIVCLGLLRPLKGALIALQYVNLQK